MATKKNEEQQEQERTDAGMDDRTAGNSIDDNFGTSQTARLEYKEQLDAIREEFNSQMKKQRDEYQKEIKKRDDIIHDLVTKPYYDLDNTAVGIDEYIQQKINRKR